MKITGAYGVFKHRGPTWRTAFLKTDSAMSEEDRLKIRIQMADMFVDKKDRIKVKGDGYEGVIKTDGKYVMLGAFGGIQVDGELETNHGKRKLSVILAEPIDASLN